MEKVANIIKTNLHNPNSQKTTFSHNSLAKIINGKAIMLQKEVPLLMNTEVLVIGGGPSGVCAAISAARNGADVVLIERYGCLGGLATGGLVTLLMGYDDGEIQVVKGIAGEIKDRLIAMNKYVADPLREDRPFEGITNAEVLKDLLLKMCLNANVRILLHCYGTSALMERNALKGIIFESKCGTMAITGKVVIDTTGDGDIFASAGAEFYVEQMPIGLPFLMGGVDYLQYAKYKMENPDKWANLNKKCIEKTGLDLRVRPTPDEDVIWWNNTGFHFDTNDIQSYTEAEIKCRESIINAIIYVKDVKIPGFAKSYLQETASQLGVRHTRILKGAYFVTQDDFKNGTVFDDTILHGACGSGCNRKVGWNIPYRSLIPEKRIDNLIVAGRCVSAHHNSQLRLITFCMQMGQAAGVAATLAVKNKIQPRDLPYRSLRSILLNDGCHLP